MFMCYCFFFFFFFNDTATTEIYTLSLHDALPICDALGTGLQADARGARICLEARVAQQRNLVDIDRQRRALRSVRSEEHTSELQSPCNLVCRLLLEKKKKDRFSSDKCTQNTHYKK